MNKPLKIAAISGIIILVLSFLFGLFSSSVDHLGNQSISRLYSMVFLLIVTFFTIIYTYGYVVLAKKYNARLLLVMAWIGIIFAIIIFALFMIGNIISMIPNVNAQASNFVQGSPTTNNVNPDNYPSSNGAIINQDNNGINDNVNNVNSFESTLIDPSTGQFTEQGKAMVFVLIIIWIIFSIILGIYTILFGIGLMKLKDDVELSYASGVLNIISGATLIILIGFIIGLVSMIVEIVMFYKASNKLEGTNKEKVETKKVETKKIVKKK